MGERGDDGGWKGKSGRERGMGAGRGVQAEVVLSFFLGLSIDLEEASIGKVQGSVMSASPHQPICLKNSVKN
jgi:hypothetical protein